MIGQLFVPIYLYGVLMTIAFIVSLVIFFFNLKKVSVNTSTLIDFALIFSLSAIVGARVMYVILYPDQFSSMRDYLAIYEGGMVFYGGFILAMVNSIMYILIKKLSLPRIADAVVPTVAIGHSIGRLGCYSNDCCYGNITQCLSFYHLQSDPQGVFRHPTQLYEAIFLFGIFVTLQYSLSKVYDLKKNLIGLISGVYLLSYSLFRFCIEFIRGDDRGGFFTSFHLSVSQCVSIIMFLIAIIWIAYMNKTREAVE